MTPGTTTQQETEAAIHHWTLFFTQCAVIVWRQHSENRKKRRGEGGEREQECESQGTRRPKQYTHTKGINNPQESRAARDKRGVQARWITRLFQDHIRQDQKAGSCKCCNAAEAQNSLEHRHLTRSPCASLVCCARVNKSQTRGSRTNKKETPDKKNNRGKKQGKKSGSLPRGSLPGVEQ